jgi:hypothetical protein
MLTSMGHIVAAYGPGGHATGERAGGLWVPIICATWADALRNAIGSVEHSASAGPVLARPEVG